MLDVALKEWSIVCELLLEGELAMLLRKGGIHEAAGPGGFELEHDRFAFYPSWAHQRPEMVKPPWRDRVQVLPEPAEVALRACARVTDVWQVPSRAAIDKLDGLHPWTAEHVDMRFNYQSDRPLYLLAVRVARLVEPKTVATRTEYTGCRSWVPLRSEDAVDERDAQPVLGDTVYRALVDRLAAAMV